MTTTSSELSSHLNNMNNNITISMKILGSSNSGGGNDENKNVHGKKKKKKVYGWTGTAMGAGWSRTDYLEKKRARDDGKSTDKEEMESLRQYCITVQS